MEEGVKLRSLVVPSYESISVPLEYALYALYQYPPLEGAVVVYVVTAPPAEKFILVGLPELVESVYTVVPTLMYVVLGVEGAPVYTGWFQQLRVVVPPQELPQLSTLVQEVVVAIPHPVSVVEYWAGQEGGVQPQPVHVVQLHHPVPPKQEHDLTHWGRHADQLLSKQYVPGAPHGLPESMQPEGQAAKVDLEIIAKNTITSATPIANIVFLVNLFITNLHLDH